MTQKLNLMDTFPALTLTATDQSQVRLPDDIGADYAVVLFYRGHW